MVIIITGEIGSGKTTVCQKLLRRAQSKGVPCGGIITSKAPDGSIIIEDVKTGNCQTFASTEAKYDGPCTGKYYFNPAAIDFGVQAIDSGAADDILFVDEIGYLELRGKGFSRATEVINTRKAKQAILVIRKELLPLFLPRLSSKPLVFEVTVANRNELPKQVWSHLFRSTAETAFVSAIMLAAGEGKRLGGEKLLLPLGDSTIIERTIDNFLVSNVDEVIVVTGHRAQEMKEAIGGRRVKIALNRAYRQGLSTSIIKGLGIVDERASAIMFALADQPFIDSALINRLIEEFMNSGKGIVLPVYQGRRGHPVIFSIKYRNELLKLKGDVGARELLGRHADDLREVEVDSGSILSDIDTTENYQATITRV